MNTHRRLLLRLVLGVIPSLACGQHVLLVKDGPRTRIVVDAMDTRPMVQENGKLETINASRYALIPGGQYLPLFVAVRHPHVKTSAMQLNALPGQLNKTFHFRCELESAYELSHVVLVLTLHNVADKGLFLYGVGNLHPREVRDVDLAMPMLMESAPGNYRLYLFSGGRELFQSMMPVGAMDSALNKLVRERIKGMNDSPPRPLLGPVPEYPKALRRKKVAGGATVSFRVGFNGAISEPALVKASQPEFGEAVMAVIKQWRFLPEMKRGRPTATRVEMPFDFIP